MNNKFKIQAIILFTFVLMTGFVTNLQYSNANSEDKNEKNYTTEFNDSDNLFSRNILNGYNIALNDSVYNDNTDATYTIATGYDEELYDSSKDISPANNPPLFSGPENKRTINSLPAITSPANNSTLCGSNVTFLWTAGSNVDEYHLYVATMQGGKNVHNQSHSIALKAEVGGVPTSGNVYTRLWYRIGISWSFIDYTYTGGPAISGCSGGSSGSSSSSSGSSSSSSPGSTGSAAGITSPANGSTLSGSSVTFTWNAGSGITEYWLYIGTSAGASSIYNKSQGLSLQVTLSSLPTTGTIYVRLWSKLNSSWIFNDYTYTGAQGTGSSNGSTGVSGGSSSTGDSNAPQITDPVDGSILSGNVVTFTWSAGSGVEEYWLQIGSKLNGIDIYDASQGTSLQTKVGSIPLSGAVYVKLWYRISTLWKYTVFTYSGSISSDTDSGTGNSSSTNVTKAAIISPQNGTTLTSTSVTFKWSSAASALCYWLMIGDNTEEWNIYTASQDLNTSVTLDGLPGDSRTLYVRLWTKGTSGIWVYNDYIYTGSNGSSSNNNNDSSTDNSNNSSANSGTIGTGISVNNDKDGPIITLPVNGSTLTSSVETYEWSTIQNIDEYWLYLGTYKGAKNVFNNSVGKTSQTVVGGIPTNGEVIYARIWYRRGTLWKFNDFIYTAFK